MKNANDSDIMHVENRRLDELKPVYAIEVTGKDGGPIAGLSGLLSERGTQMLFNSSEDAKTRIDYIRSVCLNKNPVADYKCVRYRETNEPRTLLRLERITEYDMTPAFDPNNFEVRSRDFGSVGGEFVAADVEIYLPELDKTVWIVCTDELTEVTSVNQDDYDIYADSDNVQLFITYCGEAPREGYETFAPMIKAAIEYSIDKEVEHTRGGLLYWLRAEFLPDKYAETVEKEYLKWLSDNDECVTIGADGKIVYEVEYKLSQAQNDAPELAR